jgi:lipopolysaccharide export LptBFGC system permease protein LptF
MKHAYEFPKLSFYFRRFFIFDRYYNGIFLKNLFIFTFLFLFIYFFATLLVQVPSIMRKASYNEFVTAKNVLTYYLFQIPNYINITIPFAFLFALSYTLGNFYSTNNALILVSCGVPVWRITIGSVFIAFFISILLIILNISFFPKMIEKSVEYNKKFNFVDNKNFIQNVDTQDDNGYMYFANYFSIENSSLNEFLIIKKAYKCPHPAVHRKGIQSFEKLTMEKKLHLFDRFLNSDLPECFLFQEIIRGENLVFDAIKKIWVGYHGIFYKLDLKTLKVKEVIRFQKQEFPFLRIDIKSFSHIRKDIEEMSVRESINYIHYLKSNKEPLEDTLINFYDTKFLKPLSLTILSLFVVNVGSFFSRKHLFISTLLISFCLVFGFYLLVDIGYSLAKSHFIPLQVGLFLGDVFGLLFFIFFKIRQRT